MALDELFQQVETPTAQTVRLISESLVGAKNTLRAAWGNVNLMIWQNPYGLTPQEVFDALGPRGGMLLALSQQIAPQLDAADPDNPLPSLRTKEIAIDERGNVTLS